jgi:hypothetical protein
MKQHWITPRLTVHGDVRKLTLTDWQWPDVGCGPWEKRLGDHDGIVFMGINVPIHCLS